MKSIMPQSKSKNNEQQVPAHLQKLYDAREQRTINLVKSSIDALIEANQPVSLRLIVAKSKEIDPKGQGVSITAIQRNVDANAYYHQHRSYNNSPTKPSYLAVKKLPHIDIKKLKVERDLSQVRQRYLKLTKEELVDRIIAIEQILAEQENNWHEANDELLSQILEVESENLLDDRQNSASGELQSLTNQIKLLRSKNKDLKAQLAGMKALEADKKQLESENQRLFNKILQLESSKRSKDTKSFADARKSETKQPDIPDIEY
jgi:hypothetical protein